MTTGIYSQVDSLFGEYGGGFMHPRLLLNSDSTFEYCNGFDIGSPIWTKGNYHKIDDTVFFNYNSKITPEIIDVKESKIDSLEMIKISVVNVDENNILDSISNCTVQILLHKSPFRNPNQMDNLYTDKKGVTFIADMSIDSIIIQPDLWNPIYYHRKDKNKNFYEFRIWTPSLPPIYYFEIEKLYFWNGCLYFDKDKEGYFWDNSDLYKSKKDRERLSVIQNVMLDNKR